MEMEFYFIKSICVTLLLSWQKINPHLMSAFKHVFTDKDLDDIYAFLGAIMIFLGIFFRIHACLTMV